jgi:HAD superfamily hydrolase (TIGR01484 family)
MKKLALFDIDGTIATHGKLDSTAVAGIQHLQTLGYTTSVCTGRGYLRMKHALGDDYGKVVSPDALVVLEHGTKITTRDGEVVFADYLSANELQHVVDFIDANISIIAHVWFISTDPQAPYSIWCKSEADIAEVFKKRGAYSNVFTCSSRELYEKLKQTHVSSVTAKLESFMNVQNLLLHFTRSDINLLFQDSLMEFIKNIASKAKAIMHVQEQLSIPTNRLLVAGNAINDVDMLNMNAHKRILVGDDASAATVLGHLTEANDIIRVQTPSELGEYLLKIEQ